MDWDTLHRANLAAARRAARRRGRNQLAIALALIALVFVPPLVNGLIALHTGQLELRP